LPLDPDIAADGCDVGLKMVDKYAVAELLDLLSSRRWRWKLAIEANIAGFAAAEDS
jgi:hypothetical protein